MATITHPKAPRKVVITCAVTGAIHTPTMSPYLPITADEIAAAAIGAHEAGAAIVHLHARDPKDGRPDQRPEAFEPFLKKIKQACDVVINITTGGAPTMLVEERLKPCAHFKPEVASLNMGSMNFGLYPMLDRYREFKYDWERPYLEGSNDRIFRNTFKDIENILTTCRANGTRFEVECYDIGHLYTLRHFAGPRPDQAAVLHPVGVRAPRRHRPASRGRGAHEAHRRPPVRRPVHLERAGRRTQPDADRRAVGGPRRQRARRASRTRCGSGPASSPRPTRSRCAPRAR
jgi:uncharacterized protein (DUF849 family)